MAEWCWEGDVEVEITVKGRLHLEGYTPVLEGQEEPTDEQMEKAKVDALAIARKELETGKIVAIGPVLEYGITDKQYVLGSGKMKLDTAQAYTHTTEGGSL